MCPCLFNCDSSREIEPCCLSAAFLLSWLWCLLGSVCLAECVERVPGSGSTTLSPALAPRWDLAMVSLCFLSSYFFFLLNYPEMARKHQIAVGWLVRHLQVHGARLSLQEPNGLLWAECRPGCVWTWWGSVCHVEE